MKIKILYILSMLFVLSCSNSNKDKVWCKIIRGVDRDILHIKNVSFIPYNQEIIIKQTQEVKQHFGMEGQESKIDIDIFDLITRKKLHSFSVDADKIHFSNLNYYLTTKYGCCAAPHELEMGEIWKDNVFLRAEDEVFAINRQLYFGFTNAVRNNEGILGELNFARGYDHNTSFKPDKKLIFKVRNKELKKEYYYLSPTITLVAPNSIPHWTSCSLYKNISFSGKLEEINHNIIKIDFVFGGDTERAATVDIPLQNGYIFGNRNFEQLIYVDDYLKN